MELKLLNEPKQSTSLQSQFVQQNRTICSKNEPIFIIWYRGIRCQGTDLLCKIRCIFNCLITSPCMDHSSKCSGLVTRTGRGDSFAHLLSHTFIFCVISNDANSLLRMNLISLSRLVLIHQLFYKLWSIGKLTWFHSMSSCLTFFLM